MDSPSPEVVERLATIVIRAMDDHTLAYNEHEKVQTFIAKAILSSPIISDLIAEARAEERGRCARIVAAADNRAHAGNYDHEFETALAEIGAGELSLDEGK